VLETEGVAELVADLGDGPSVPQAGVGGEAVEAGIDPGEGNDRRVPARARETLLAATSIALVVAISASWRPAAVAVGAALLVYAAVDFATLSRLVLARNWSRFTPDQQTAFVEEFKRHLSVTYGDAVDSYKNEEVQITGDREEARGDWTVRTKVLRGGPDDILVDYRLRNVGDEWKIIDFVVEGVSLVANFRAQFQELLGSNTPEGLIQLLRDKNAKGESIVKDEDRKR